MEFLSILTLLISVLLSVALILQLSRKTLAKYNVVQSPNVTGFWGLITAVADAAKINI